jgi:hypothetical protein
MRLATAESEKAVLQNAVTATDQQIDALSVRQFPEIPGPEWGEHPMVGSWFSSHVHSMSPNPFAPNAKQKSDRAQNSAVGEALIEILTAFPPAPAAVARRAYAIYEQQGSRHGHDVKHWLEAEAQLLGGIERGSQIHPGSSLFKTEH